MAAIPYTPGGGGLEADIMETLAFFNSDSIEQDHLLQSSTCVPPIPSSSFTIPFVEDNGCAAAPPCRSRSSRTESLRNGKLFVDIDSHYTDSEDECAGVGRLHSRRSNTSSKRDRATHVHNLSEKRRRDRINEKMKELQLLVPNSKKTDKASMLDEAIDYVKQLQLQVQILSSPNKMNQSHSCVAMGIPCFQMPQMCMNMNMGFMGMGINMVHSHSQWNNGCMTVPQGVQGQPILPWSNEQNKEYFNAANQPMFKKVSEHNNLCEAGSGNTSRPRHLQATHSQ